MMGRAACHRAIALLLVSIAILRGDAIVGDLPRALVALMPVPAAIADRLITRLTTALVAPLLTDSTVPWPSV